MRVGRLDEGHGMDEWSRKMHDIMDEMRNRRFFHFRDSKVWQPATNVYESRENYHIGLDLAGMDEADIAVECLDERRVRVTGVRGSPRPPGTDGPLSVHVLEIDEGPFAREIDLPDAIVVDAVEASYSKGYLWISLPKATVK